MKHFALFRLMIIIIIGQCFVASVYADTIFTAYLNGAQEVPSNNSSAIGTGSVILNAAETEITVTLNISGLSSPQFVPQIEKGARGVAGQFEIGLPGGNFSQTFSVAPAQIGDLKAGLWFFNIRTAVFPNGEIRGQIEPLCAPSPAGMLDWYSGNGSAGDSFGNRHGALQNGATFANGKIRQAFKLDGFNDYVSVADTPHFRPANFTISGWFKFDGTSGASLIAKSVGTGNGVSFSLSYDGSFLRGQIGNSTALSERVSHSFAPVAGEWYHIAYTFDDAEDAQFLYLNGVAVAAQATTISMDYDSHPLTIGGQIIFESPGNFFKGGIDEVQIFSRALSASEIQAIYRVEGAGVCENATFTNIYGNGKIASYSNRTGNTDIFTMNSDGSNQTNVSQAAGINYEPAFSPGGGKIAFSSFRDGNHEIYLMNANGTNQTRLTVNAAQDAQPSWSPDGTKIVFTSDRTGGGDIYVMNSDGANQTRLTVNAALDYMPKFSSDGLQIVFVSRRDGNDEIYVMNADGSNQVRATTNSITDGFPAFSPDGRKIVFYSTRTGNQEIFIINSDGSNPVNLSNNSAADSTPTWSPDGSKIAFESNRDGNYEIYSMNADGTNQKRLTDNGAFDSYAAWQPVIGANVSPAANVNLIFPNAIKAGYTVAQSLSSGQLPMLPLGYLLRAAFAYDIRTSAQYTGGVNVQFVVRDVADAQTCAALRVLHFIGGNWDEANNSVPEFNSGVCRVRQAVNSLSMFVVAEQTPAAQGRALAGKIIYGATPAGAPVKFVSDALLIASGATLQSVTSDSAGGYLINDLDAASNYVVKPLKVGNANGITAFDATLVLRCVAAGNGCSLTPNQRLAADADGNGQITAFDATLILRYVAANGQTAATGAVGKWQFAPVERAYNSTPVSLSGEDFTAILIGDVDGNWTP